MRRAFGLLCILLMAAMVAGCSGGGTEPTLDEEAGPLSVTLWADPQVGSTPVRVTFTAHVTGGVAPYFYAWDYQATDRNDDGALDLEDLVPDVYLNSEFQRTVSVSNDYYLIASDPGGISQYVAMLR